MSAHCTVENLSALLDGDLAAPTARQVESHLEECVACRDDLAALAGVVGGLRRLERVVPPDSLGLALARRVAVERRRPRLLERLEARMVRFEGQPTAGLTFALVIALAVIFYLFAHALATSTDRFIPVRFATGAEEPGTSAPEGAGADAAAPDAAVRVVAGRELHLVAGIWRQAGAPLEGALRIAVGGQEWRRVVVAEPDLAELADLEEPALLRAGGQVVLVEPAGAAAVDPPGPQR